jgi:ribose transport system permease protein
MEKQNLELRDTSLRSKTLSLLQNNIVYVVFIAILILFSIILRGNFLSVANLMNIARQTAIISIMAITMTFALSSGEIDLSIGSIVGLSACVTAIALRDYGLVVGVIAGLVSGLLVGVFNGAIVAFVRVPSFLVTLTTMGIVGALARWVVNLRAVPIGDDRYNFIFGSGDFKFIPILFIWTIVFLIIGYFLLRRTQFGKEILATGGNEKAAYFSGINTRIIKFSAMVITAFGAAVAGMLLAGRLHGARYDLGEDVALTVIAAVVIGGTSLFGGKGNIIGALFGSVMIGMINNGLILMGLNVSQQMFFRGLILLIAISINVRTQYKRA